MTTADWALVISIFSAVVAVASFLWNVWSKFIYPKPVVRVSFAMVTIMQRGAADIGVLRLGATNYGAHRSDAHAFHAALVSASRVRRQQ
jgi:hypothetical protein